MLPGASKPVVVVRFCPIKFKLLGTNTCITLLFCSLFWHNSTAATFWWQDLFFFLLHSSIFQAPLSPYFCSGHFELLVCLWHWKHSTDSNHSWSSLCSYNRHCMVIFIPPFGKKIPAYLFENSKFSYRSPAGNYLVLSSQDGYCTLLEFENRELGSPLSLSGLYMFPAAALLNEMPTWLLKHFYLVEEKQVIGDENKSHVLEAVNNNCNSESVDSRKEREENSLMEKDENKDGKQASPSTRVPPSKAAKRRITPMAID